jgi:RHS repeat-associated protein
MNHRYDVFGRATTIDVGAQVIERDSYDGYDRLIRQQKWDPAGAHKATKTSSYDPFDRTVLQTTKITTRPEVNTRYIYLGLADQVAVEEQTNTAGAYEVSKVYTHGPGGEKLALVDTPVNATTTKKTFYGVNPHGDVETLTDPATGQTTSTYRYTAYGTPDKTGTTGDDAITGDPVNDAEIVNPYRFNAKRYDAATGTYDMGFREYDPGLNRYLTRDLWDYWIAQPGYAP